MRVNNEQLSSQKTASDEKKTAAAQKIPHHLPNCHDADVDEQEDGQQNVNLPAADPCTTFFLLMRGEAVHGPSFAEESAVAEGEAEGEDPQFELQGERRQVIWCDFG